MNEEAVELGKKQLQEGLTYDQVVILFFNQASGVVKDTVETLKNELAANEQSDLLKGEVELLYFFLFALDYWWQMSSYTQEQKLIFDAVFGYHVRQWCGNDAEGQAMWDAFAERLIAYGAIVNEKTDDSQKFFGLGSKLSNYSELGSALLLAPRLFLAAFEIVSILETGKRRLK